MGIRSLQSHPPYFVHQREPFNEAKRRGARLSEGTMSHGIVATFDNRKDADAFYDWIVNNTQCELRRIASNVVEFGR